MRIQITGWVLVLIGFVAAVFLAYEAVTIPFLHGAGLAQADFELFFFSAVLGVPGIIVSLLGTLLIRRHATQQGISSPRFPVVSAAIAALTIFTVIAAFAFSLMMKSHGFFWR